MIVANNLKTAGAGFGTDTNVITIITKDSEQAFDLMSKAQAADCILDAICKQKKSESFFGGCYGVQTAQQFGQLNVSKADRNRVPGLTCVHEQVAKRIVNVRFTITIK